jgi:hypothetical protein
MQIDLGKILTNALSALVAAVFVGAAAIVWNAATSIDDRIKIANDDIIKQQAALKATQEIIGKRLTEIVTKAEENGKELKSINKILAELEILKGKVSYNPDQPFILDEFRKKVDLNEAKQKELESLSNQIDTRQMQIYEEKIKK